MSLELGKSFDRSYFVRIPFLDGFYNIGTFFNKKSSFLLFRVDPSFQTPSKHGVKVNMFKNLTSSKFVEIFLDLHTYSGQNLDIVNQFKSLKDGFSDFVLRNLNETITLLKINFSDKIFYDKLDLYSFTFPEFLNEFIFFIAERSNINTKLQKKVVRTTGVQIATGKSIDFLNEYYEKLKGVVYG